MTHDPLTHGAEQPADWTETPDAETPASTDGPMANLTAAQQQVIHWLATGETGTSSKTMAFWLAFGILPKHTGFPADVSDFGRCAKMVRACPDLRPYIANMAELSETWARMAPAWDVIEGNYWHECGNNRCPATYEWIMFCRHPELYKKPWQSTDA